jgi:hypothetical protein
MLRTILVGTAISIQGIFVRSLPDGRIVVALDNSTYTGMPVSQTT